ncbi:MAG TPA: sialidase family protein [Verrucomicrobiae bacterium]|nr:sialidase family protein [Verrucomicrobiae bacterium]
MVESRLQFWPPGRWRAAVWMTICLWLLGAATVETRAAQTGLMKAEFVVDSPAFDFSHSPSIVETKDGLLAAWVSGTQERALDVSLWMSRFKDGKWSKPQIIADGLILDERVRHPVWNPVFFQPKKGPLNLFFKIGPAPESWWGMVMASPDNGHTWGPPRRLSNNALGPIRSKPIEFKDGSVACGSSTESAGWQVRFERSEAPPFTWWSKSSPLNNAMEFAAIQPVLLPQRNGKLQMLCRTKQGVIAETWSTNKGVTWGKLQRTSLPNPNGAIDGIVLLEGMSLLVYNHSATDRSTLDVATSPNGENWRSSMVIESQKGGEFSYPSVIQTSDGLVHVVYSWNKRRIKHVVFDPWQFRTP